MPRLGFIRPLPDWFEDQNVWDPAAERIHGITREELLHSDLAPAEVAFVFDRARAGRVLACDTGRAGLDRQWLRYLYQAARRSRMPAIAEAMPSDFAGMLARDACIGPDTVEALFEIAPQISHRAAEDAAHWAWIVAALATLADISARPAGGGAALGRAPRDIIEMLSDCMPAAPDEVQYRSMPGL
jgi:hypothetical protein